MDGGAKFTVSIDVIEKGEEISIKNDLLAMHLKQVGLSGDRSFAILAHDGTGREIAFAVVDQPTHQSGHNISSLFVLLEFRRGGLGSQMMAKIEAVVRSRGSDTVFVEPSPHDSTELQDTMSFLENRGYSRVDEEGRLFTKDLRPRTP